jgi:hypothetical protein
MTVTTQKTREAVKIENFVANERNFAGGVTNIPERFLSVIRE